MFDYMEDIIYTDYLHFMEEVKRKRDEMLKFDLTLLQDHHKVYRFEEITEIPQGRFSILYEGILFECFFHYKEQGFLYTFLNGALTTEKPHFGRWSYYKFIHGSMLNIADPMYDMYEGLKLGWYYGNDKVNIRKLIADIVKRISEIVNVNSSDIVFVGSSGGGSATFECASFIEGAKTIALNPQMILEDWGYAESFKKITGNDLSNDTLGHRNEISYFLENSNSNFHILIVNIRSTADMKQLEKVIDNLGIRIKYGLNVFGHYVIWLYDAECEPYMHPHNAHEFYCIFFVWEYILKNCENDLKRNQSFINWVNEIWHYRWQLEKTLRGREVPNSEVLIQCRECGKKVAVFGTGTFLRRFDKELLDISKKNYYNVKFAIDNNKAKKGKLFDDKLPIIHPSEIENWDDFFIIITTEFYFTDIKKQLEELGLIYKKNFIIWQDLYCVK